jgi:putative oxidoreductase
MRAVMMNKVNTRRTASTFSRVLNIALWILQALLAALFLWHGQFMAFPPADMVAMINANIGAGLRVFIGVAEILAAIGLIAPGVTRILPALTALAAAGLMIVMASATALHTFRGETSSAISAAVIFVLVTAVAYLRWKVALVAPRRRV